MHPFGFQEESYLFVPECILYVDILLVIFIINTFNVILIHFVEMNHPYMSNDSDPHICPIPFPFRRQLLYECNIL